MRYMLLLLLSGIILSSCTNKTGKVELVIDSKSELGEGALWDYRNGLLLWINIEGQIVNFYNPTTSDNREMFTGQKIGTVVPAESGKYVVALQKGIYFFDKETGAKSKITDPESDIKDNRFNDGKCDPNGRFWAGTMSMVGKKNTGSLYRLDKDQSAHKMVDDVSISNGIVWSLDGTRMYYIDTPTQEVKSFDFDQETGKISNPQVAVEISKDLGAPDGMTIDEEGHLWIALWGGAAVGCWDPETGKLIRTIAVPAKNVTSCAFGDDDLETLYITTARVGTSDEELQSYPHAGGVFKVRPGVKGTLAFYYDDK